MDSHADSELLGAWRAGDQEALAVLVARHHGAVHAACVRQAPRGEVDDCVQAVFLVLSRRPAAAQQAPVLVAWLLTVARLVCRQAHRGSRRRQRAEHAAGTAQPPEAPPRPEALDHLDDCLQRLPARQREALCLQYLAGKHPAEIAEELGTSRDQVHLLVHRGLAKLRALLARRGFAIGGSALAALLTAEAAAEEPAPLALVTAVTSAAPTPAAAAIATHTMKAMTMHLVLPSAAAGLLLAAGACTFVLSAEPAATPPPAIAPTTTATSAILPLHLFELAPGQEVTITGQTVQADAKGLVLPLGKPVEVAWESRAALIRYTVISVDASTGHMAPDWAIAPSVIRADGTIVAVGRGYARTVKMALAKARMSASTEAARIGASTTVTKEEAQAGADGSSRAESLSTTVYAAVATQITDEVVTLCVDPAKAPAIPVVPGTEGRLLSSPRDNPVRCWVRVTAQVQDAKPAPNQAGTKADAERALKQLDAKIAEELSREKPQAPAPAKPSF